MKIPNHPTPRIRVSGVIWEGNGRLGSVWGLRNFYFFPQVFKNVARVGVSGRSSVSFCNAHPMKQLSSLVRVFWIRFSPVFDSGAGSEPLGGRISGSSRGSDTWSERCPESNIRCFRNENERNSAESCSIGSALQKDTDKLPLTPTLATFSNT